MTERCSWTTSLEGKKDGRDFEIDFGIWQTWGLGEKEPNLIFGEAKTFNDFAPEDFRRAEQLLRDFPEATMTFATMRLALTETERKSIRKLAAKGRGDPYRGRIVVLTANELSDQDAISLHYGWEKQGGQPAEVAKRHQHIDTLPELSDATLDLYAGLRWPSSSPALGQTA